MDDMTELIKLVTALVALATAIVNILSKAGGSNDRDDENEGRNP